MKTCDKWRNLWSYIHLHAESLQTCIEYTNKNDSNTAQCDKLRSYYSVHVKFWRDNALNDNGLVLVLLYSSYHLSIHLASGHKTFLEWHDLKKARVKLSRHMIEPLLLSMQE
jgi:hypothetical protein